MQTDRDGFRDEGAASLLWRKPVATVVLAVAALAAIRCGGGVTQPSPSRSTATDTSVAGAGAGAQAQFVRWNGPQEGENILFTQFDRF